MNMDCRSLDSFRRQSYYDMEKYNFKGYEYPVHVSLKASMLIVMRSCGNPPGFIYKGLHIDFCPLDHVAWQHDVKVWYAFIPLPVS